MSRPLRISFNNAVYHITARGNRKEKILDANLRFCELFGYSLSEIKGRNIDEGLIHPPDKVVCKGGSGLEMTHFFNNE